MRMNSQIDISSILPTIRVPTLVVHRPDDKTINVEGGRYLAEHIPGARYIELPGVDHPPWFGDNAGEIADAIQEFLTGARGPVESDRVLATVLFTDIVGSTEKAAALGDSRWYNLLDTHHAIINRNLARFRGHEIKVLATVFWRPSTVPRVVFAAPALSLRKYPLLELMFARVSTRASAKSWVKMLAA
jgi:hypothetical protein